MAAQCRGTGQGRPATRALSRAVAVALLAELLSPTLVLAQQARPRDFGLRGVDAATPAPSQPERRAADLTAGSNPPTNDSGPNYGRPRRRKPVPRAFPPRVAPRPALPALEPYRSSPQRREERRLRPALPVVAPDAEIPRIPPPPTVAALPALPVKPRPRPDPDPFAPAGIGIGSLRLRPFVESGIGYDSNPNRVTTPLRGSAFWRGDAGVAIQSDWSQHAVTGSLRAGYSDYFSEPRANRPDGVGAVAGRIDLTRDTSINVGGAFALDTLRPGSPELLGVTTAGSTNRPLVWTLGGYGGVTHRFNRLEVSLRGTVDRSEYGNASFSDGTRQYLSLNNYTTVGIVPRLSYELTPGLRPFLEATLDKRVYDNTSDVNGYRRSSKGVTVRGGAAFELTRLVAGEVSGGVIERNYDDQRLPTLRGPVVDAALIWTATPLTTVTLRGSTTVNETTIANVSGALTRRVSGEIAHALLRNVTLVGSAAYQTSDYKGADLATSPTGAINEKFFTAGVRAEYNLTRTVVVKASYNHERLKSTVAGSDYTANIFLLGLRLQR